MPDTFLTGIISDPHIAPTDEMPFETNVRDNFLQAVKDLMSTEPDHIVITGDLCYREPDKNTYQWIKKILDDTSVPYSIISGNHDNPETIAEVFGLQKDLKKGELFYTRTLGPHNAIFLDTSRAVMSEEQMLWFKAQLTATCQHPVIFMHHPPCKARVKYMDANYPFLMEEEFTKTVSLCCKSATIFCGHYHVDKTVIKDNITVFLTGSTFFSIDENSKEFRKEEKAPGWRLVEMGKDSISTSHKYLKI